MAGCHMTKVYNIFGKFITEIMFLRSWQENFPTISWKIWSCDNQLLPGPFSSRSTTEALVTRLVSILNTLVSLCSGKTASP